MFIKRGDAKIIDIIKPEDLNEEQEESFNVLQQKNLKNKKVEVSNQKNKKLN